jgi:copper resistance protein B
MALATVSNAQAAAADDPLLTKVVIDQFEQDVSHGENAQSWSAQAWLGHDLYKFWLTTEGERSDNQTTDAQVELLYSRAFAPYWDWKVGVRKDFKPTPSTERAVLGVQGLAPYYFEIDAEIYLGKDGNTAFTFEAEYELMLTQRLVLSPEIEVNLYGQNDPEIGSGSGLSQVEAGLRLRYEIIREFAPYVGLTWSKKYGKTADYAALEGESSTEKQVVVGFRAWF